MALRTVYDAVTNPLGTARILEGHSTLRRTKEAELTYDQICKVFPDAKKYTSAQLDGFILIGADLAAGRSRFSGRLFDSGSAEAGQPKAV